MAILEQRVAGMALLSTIAFDGCLKGMCEQ